jgi:NRAMP (natural resistance-associated macrophage protein)-like metal ion transporter
MSTRSPVKPGSKKTPAGRAATRSRPRKRTSRQTGDPAPPAKRRFWRFLGPGLITGASDDDPSGIATCSQLGAQFGYGLAWTLVFSFPLMAAIQEISARAGRVTGRGIAGNLAKYYSPWLVRGIVLLLLIANIANLGADLGAMGAALTLLIGGPPHLYVVLFAAGCAALQIFSRYENYVSILKWSTLALLAYVATVFTVHAPWGHFIFRTFVPSITFSQDYMIGIVAVLGTTISPYLFFWQSSQEAEDERIAPAAKPLKEARGQAPAELRRIRFDTYIGMGLSNLISLCIIYTTAATLHANNVTDIQTSAQAAEALRPIAGPFAFAVFAAGIIGTGLLAVPVLAGSAAYAVGEAFNWPSGLARLPLQAKAFYATIVVATLLGVAINFTSIDPIKALFWSAVLNGIIAVPIMVVMMFMTMRPDIMGELVLPKPLWVVGWIATGVMIIVVAAMLATSFL